MRKFRLEIRLMVLVVSLVGASMAVVQSVALIKARASKSKPPAVAGGKAPSPQTLARMSEQPSLFVSERDSPLVSLRDGHDLISSYTGAPELVALLEQNQARPLSLATADFDEDGVPDLLSGFAASVNGFAGSAGRGPQAGSPLGVLDDPPASGAGLITLHRGNLDAIYPNTPEAQQRKAADEFTDAPFLSAARVFALPEQPDFIGAGDFDADGHWDVVMAARGSMKLYWMAGDGRGDFGRAQVIALPGVVTALVTGEINRADGLVDVVVGVAQAASLRMRGAASLDSTANSEERQSPSALLAAEPHGMSKLNAPAGSLRNAGAQALVFEGAEGALRHEPEIIALPGTATSFSLGQLDDSYEMDLAVASGRNLLIVRGRDRRLSLDQEEQAKVQPAEVEQQSMPFKIASIAIGDFTRGDINQIAALSEDGAVRVMERDGKTVASSVVVFSGGLLPADDSSFATRAGSSPPLNEVNEAREPSPALVRARVSVTGFDDLVVRDRDNRQFHIVSSAVQSADLSRRSRHSEKNLTKVGILNLLHAALSSFKEINQDKL
ncbi:MAG: VCBS repeat-containing protein [Pyrinomonadaceae bacterium]